MLMQRGLIVVLCLLASASARGKRPHIRWMDLLSVNGCNPMWRYGEYNCGPSDQFEGFTWCQKCASRGSGKVLQHHTLAFALPCRQGCLRKPF